MQAVFSAEYAEALSYHAVLSHVKVSAHIKIDTGMSRIGFRYHDSIDDYPVLDEIERACALPGLQPEGIFTHFARADETDLTAAKEQSRAIRGNSFQVSSLCRASAPRI